MDQIPQIHILGANVYISHETMVTILVYILKILQKKWFQIGEKEERARESRNGALRLFLTVTGARTLCSSDS